MEATKQPIKGRKASPLSLFLTFFKIGLFTFGGGYAMIALIQREISERKGWITEEELLEIVAVSESTPGPIAINAATFVGYRTAGAIGSTFATLGVVLPSYIIMTVIAYVLQEFSSLAPVRSAFFGIRAGVLALILRALVKMFKAGGKGVFAYAVMLAAFVAVAILKLPVIGVLAASAVAGLVYSLIESKRGGQGK